MRLWIVIIFYIISNQDLLIATRYICCVWIFVSSRYTFLSSYLHKVSFCDKIYRFHAEIGSRIGNLWLKFIPYVPGKILSSAVKFSYELHAKIGSCLGKISCIVWWRKLTCVVFVGFFGSMNSGSPGFWLRQTFLLLLLRLNIKSIISGACSAMKDFLQDLRSFSLCLVVCHVWSWQFSVTTSEVKEWFLNWKIFFKIYDLLLVSCGLSCNSVRWINKMIDRRKFRQIKCKSMLV